MHSVRRAIQYQMQQNADEIPCEAATAGCTTFWAAQSVRISGVLAHIVCLLDAGKQGTMETVSQLQKNSASNGNSKGDLEAALPVAKSDSAADLAAPPDHDPAKSVIYQDKMADQNAPQRSVKLDKSQRMFWGIGVAVLAGVVGSLFSPGFNVVTNDAFHTLAPGVEPLTVYTGYILLGPCGGI